MVLVPFLPFTQIMTDLSLETGFENNKAPVQWFGRRPQWRICFVCFFLAEKLSLSLCVSLSQNKLCVREANFAKLNHRRVLSYLSSCYIVSKVPEFTAKTYSAIKHRPELKLNK